MNSLDLGFNGITSASLWGPNCRARWQPGDQLGSGVPQAREAGGCQGGSRGVLRGCQVEPIGGAGRLDVRGGWGVIDDALAQMGSLTQGGL